MVNLFSRFKTSKKKSSADYSASALGHFPPPEPHFSILLQLIDEAEPKEGIFRIPGSKNEVDLILNYLEVSKGEINEKKIRDKLKSYSLHTLCSALKAYLGSISLICSSEEQWNELLEVLGSQDLDELKEFLDNRVATDRRRVLYRLLDVIEKKTHQPEIKMNAQNMAVVFAPTLTNFDGKDESDSLNPTAALLRHQQQLSSSVPMVVTMLENKDYLFESVKDIPTTPVFDDMTEEMTEEVSEEPPHPEQPQITVKGSSTPRADADEPEINGNPHLFSEEVPVETHEEELADVSGRDLVHESINAGTNTPPQTRNEPEHIELRKPDPMDYEDENDHQYNNLEELEEEIEEERMKHFLQRIENEQAQLRADLGKMNLTQGDIVAITTEEFHKMMNASNISIIVKEELDKEMKRYTRQWNSDVKSIKRDVVQHKKRTEHEIQTIAKQSAKSASEPSKTTSPPTLEATRSSIEAREFKQLKKDLQEVKDHFAKYDAIINRLEAKQDSIMVQIDEIGKANASTKRAFEMTLDSTRGEVRKQDLQIRELTTQIGSLQSKFEGRAKVLEEYYPSYQLNGLSAFSKGKTSPKWNLDPPNRTPPKPPIDDNYSRGDISPVAIKTPADHSPDSQNTLLGEHTERRLSHDELTEQLERLQKKYLGNVIPLETRYSHPSTGSGAPRTRIHKPFGSTRLVAGSSDRTPRFGTLYSSVSNRAGTGYSSQFHSTKKSPVTDVSRPSYISDPSGGVSRRASSLSSQVNSGFTTGSNLNVQSTRDMEARLSGLRKELDFEVL
mmetsp:Transcript_11303/g.42346  ORF Transcript_11303/g.42346 Transcript_11303/m.42346 type:complete len:786 (-) Transcript_11303:832-3189(-)